MKEKFAKPAVRAIIEREISGIKYILIQERQKDFDCGTNGLLELPGGKIREYENAYNALKREVLEETGLSITNINGEKNSISNTTRDFCTFCYSPFCVTQNLSGGYSLIVHTFICEATGTLLNSSDESCNIHWISIENLKQLLQTTPQNIFPLDIISLQKYVNDFFPH